MQCELPFNQINNHSGGQITINHHHREIKPVPQCKSDPKTVRIDADKVDAMNRAMRAERSSFSEFVNKGIEICNHFSFEEINCFIQNHDVFSFLANQPEMIELFRKMIAKKI